MRKWLKLLPLLCLCLATSAFVLAGEPIHVAREYSPRPQRSPAPSLQVLHSTFTFVYSGDETEISHDFRVRNSGNGTLRIEEIAPD